MSKYVELRNMLVNTDVVTFIHKIDNDSCKNGFQFAIRYCINTIERDFWYTLKEDRDGDYERLKRALR